MSVDVAIKHDFATFGLDVAFRVEEPGITALFGPSGSGKTTTINAIAGLLEPKFGTVRVNGRTLFDTDSGISVRPRERRIGYVFQESRLFPHLSVQSNLLYGWRRTGKPVGQADMDDLIARLGIDHLMARKPHALSGGERQRVALGRALLMRPDALLLDEPMAALDQARRGEILPYLAALRDSAEIPMIYVSHAIDEVAGLADHMVLLDQGRVRAEGSVSDIMSRLDLFPLTGRYEAGAVLPATIASHDPEDALTEVTVAGGRLVVPLIDRPVGDQLRLRIRARDVMIALDRPATISANNILATTISEIRQDPGPFADLQLDCNGSRILARVTRRSVARLGLMPGLEVQAVIKTVTVDRRTLSPGPGADSD